MAVTVTKFDHYEDMVLGGLDWDTDTLMLALFTSSFTPDTAETSFGNLTNECTGTGYTAGGEAVTNVAKESGVVTADPVSWAEITVSARYAVLYTTATIDGITNPVLLVYDFGSELTLSAIPWSFSWASNILYQLT
jgi:hypothetical protein